MNRVYTVEGFIYSREGLSVCVGCVSGMRRPSSTPREGHSDASDKRIKGRQKGTDHKKASGRADDAVCNRLHPM